MGGDVAARDDGRAVVVAMAGAACISSSAILIQLAGQSAATTAFFRCAVALPVLVPLAILEARRHGRRPAAAHWKAVAAGGAFAVDLVLWNHAIADVGAGVATVLGNLQVLFVATAAWVIFHERPSPRFVVALPVVATGVVLVAGVLGHSSFGHHPVAGILYGLGTSIAYAVFLLVMRTASASAVHVAGPLLEATAGAAVACVVLGEVFGGMGFDPGWPAIGWLALLALLSQVIGWLLITWALPKLASALSSLLLLLQPGLALLLAAAVLSQRPTGWQILGAGLVCCGVLVAAWRPSDAVRREGALVAAGEERRAA